MVALLRWWSGPSPPPGKQYGRGGRSNKHRAPKVAAPPTVGPGAAAGVAAGAAAPSPEGEQQQGGGQQARQDLGLQAATTAGAQHLGPLRRLHLLARAVAMPSLHLAARLLSKPWQPIHEQLEQRLAGMQGVKDACRALHVESLQELQDVLGSLILSECVYKVLDMEDGRALQAVNALKAYFPPQLVTLRRVQWALPHAAHSFLMADSDNAVYVAFMGTKRPRDMVTNVNLFQDQILFDAAASVDADVAGAQGAEAPAAHRGFSARARAIPIEALYHQAQAQGKRLVLCGHSLGGAVAQLCAIRLLQQLPPAAHGTVSCIGFATPPIGNLALADLVRQSDWDRRIRNYLLPEDPIPRLLSSRQPVAAAAAAEGPAVPAVAGAAAEPAAASAGAAGAAAALASVSVHRAPGLPGLSKPFWVRRDPALAPTALQAAAAAKESRSSSSGSAQGLSAASVGVSSATRLGPELELGLPAQSPANNISAAPRLGILRLSRLAKHVAPGAASHGGGNGGSGREVVAAAAVGGSLDGPEGASGGAGVALAEVDGGHTADGRAAAAAVAAASLPVERLAEQESDGILPLGAAEGEESVGAAEGGLEGLGSRHARRRRLRWRVLRPPLEAMAQSAQAAARLVTLPLTVAASVPSRVTPDYHCLGQTLFVLPDAVTTTLPEPAQQQRGGSKRRGAASEAAPLPHSQSAGTLQEEATATAAARQRPRLFWRAASSPALQQQQQAEGEESEGAEDVAEAARALAAVATSAERPALQGPDPTLAPLTLPPRTLFPHHRMLSYRNRMLGITKGALRGRVWLPALPHLGNLPHPDDVALSLLVAPGLFPLKAEASLLQPAPSAATSPTAAAAPAATPPSPRGRQRAAAAAGGASAEGGEEASGGQGRPVARPRRRWGLLRLFRRPGEGQEGGPVELLVRVEGRGLHLVRSAWVESGLPGTGRGGGGSAEAVAAQVIWQPASPSPAAVHRGPLRVVTPVSAFFSWLAVSFGWVTLLRRLQPAGRSDYLLARVALPASLAQQAQLAASSPLQAAVNDTHLPGVRVGPSLTLTLQSDFSRMSVPLDIRAAADVHARLPGLGWPRLLPRKWWE